MLGEAGISPIALIQSYECSIRPVCESIHWSNILNVTPNSSSPLSYRVHSSAHSSFPNTYHVPDTMLIMMHRLEGGFVYITVLWDPKLEMASNLISIVLVAWKQLQPMTNPGFLGRDPVWWLPCTICQVCGAKSWLPINGPLAFGELFYLSTFQVPHL